MPTTVAGWGFILFFPCLCFCGSSAFLFIFCFLNNIFAHVDINKKSPLLEYIATLSWVDFFHEYIAKKVQKGAWMYLLLCRSGLCLQWYWLLGGRALCEKVDREVREQKNVKYKRRNIMAISEINS